MRECQCAVPQESVDPRRRDLCEHCSRRINPAWTSNDGTLAEFFDRLEEALPHDPALPGLRAQATARELAGRETFGNSFLSRENAAEGMEEASDGALYALFELLVARRHGDEEDWASALTAARHFALAHYALAMMRHRRTRPLSG